MITHQMQLFNFECFHIVLFKNSPEVFSASSSRCTGDTRFSDTATSFSTPDSSATSCLTRWKLFAVWGSKSWLNKETPFHLSDGILNHSIGICLLLRISSSRRLNAFPISREHKFSLSSPPSLKQPPVERALETLYCRLPFKWNRTHLYLLEWFF